MRYGQIVMGPAGSGKSTYCSTLVKHAEVSKRRVHVINLDPAAETFEYEPTGFCEFLSSFEWILNMEFSLENFWYFGKNYTGRPLLTSLLSRLEKQPCKQRTVWLEDRFGPKLKNETTYQTILYSVLCINVLLENCEVEVWTACSIWLIVYLGWAGWLILSLNPISG